MAFAMKKQPGGYDNNYPRVQEAMLKGLGARAVAAHKNSFESLILFTAAVTTALATQQTSSTIQYLAITHLIARIIYHFLYLFNWATLRSTIWSVGVITSLSILWLCLP